MVCDRHLDGHDREREMSSPTIAARRGALAALWPERRDGALAAAYGFLVVALVAGSVAATARRRGGWTAVVTLWLAAITVLRAGRCPCLRRRSSCSPAGWPPSPHGSRSRPSGRCRCRARCAKCSVTSRTSVSSRAASCSCGALPCRTSSAACSPPSRCSTSMRSRRACCPTVSACSTRSRTTTGSPRRSPTGTGWRYSAWWESCSRSGSRHALEPSLRVRPQARRYRF